VNTAQTQHHLKRKRQQYALSQQKRLIVSEVFEKAKVFGPSVFSFLFLFEGCRKSSLLPQKMAACLSSGEFMNLRFK
jgi:hypothetical protein